MTAGQRNAPGEQIARARASTVADILVFIDAHVTDRDLTPERVEEHFEMPRSTLYRILQPYGGVRACILARRLDRIARVLLDGIVGPTELGPLVRSHGFVSFPHFSRTFGKQFGMTARNYIALAHSADADWRAAQIERVGNPEA